MSSNGHLLAANQWTNHERIENGAFIGACMCVSLWLSAATQYINNINSAARCVNSCKSNFNFRLKCNSCSQPEILFCAACHVTPTHNWIFLQAVIASEIRSIAGSRLVRINIFPAIMRTIYVVHGLCQHCRDSVVLRHSSVRSIRHTFL